MNLTNKQKYIRRTLQKSYLEKKSIPNYLVENIQIKAPMKFDLLNNSDESICFFNNIINFIKIHKDDNIPYRINILLNDITHITVETIMYLIALSNNSSKWKNIRFNVILPKDNNLCNLILSTGIHNYMAHSQVNIPETDKYFYVRHGDILNKEIARKICDFVNEILKKDRIYSKFLYDMLVEMMINTADHAYNSNSNIFDKKWYVCVEDSDNAIKFYFLDTGIGIPETMLKYLYEISNVINSNESIIFSNDDSKLLLATLKGKELVTRTKLTNRGKGLPEIYAHFSEGKKTSNFKVMSGKGHCSFENENRDKEILIELRHKFEGTLFYWEIDKLSLMI